jgi:hypothetical protein
MKIAEHGPDSEPAGIVDSVPALIHTARPGGFIDFFNQRWLEFVGLRLEDRGWKWTARSPRRERAGRQVASVPCERRAV